MMTGLICPDLQIPFPVVSEVELTMQSKIRLPGAKYAHHVRAKILVVLHLASLRLCGVTQGDVLSRNTRGYLCP